MTSHASILLDYLHGLWKDQRLTDVIIQFGDSQFRAHSLLLSAYSRYFRAILCTTIVDPSGLFYLDVTHTGISRAQIFQDILEFLYTGKTTHVTNEEHFKDSLKSLLVDIPIPPTDVTGIKLEPGTVSMETLSDVIGDVTNENVDVTTSPPVKRKRGRPRKNEVAIIDRGVTMVMTTLPPEKRGRGRPSKNSSVTMPTRGSAPEDTDLLLTCDVIDDDVKPPITENESFVTLTTRIEKTERREPRKMGPLSKTSAGYSTEQAEHADGDVMDDDDIPDDDHHHHNDGASDDVVSQKKNSGKKMKSYTCSVCNKDIQGKQAFLRHRESHTDNDELYICTLCDKPIQGSGSLRQHLKEAHPGQEARIPGYNVFPCGKCPEVFGTRGGARKHRAREHRQPHGRPTLGPVPCEVCGKMYRTPGLVSRHMRSAHHSRERNFPCDECDKAFCTAELLYAHKKLHQEWGKDYYCHHCGKRFNSTLSLRKHITYVHEKRKIFICEICEKPLADKFNLKRHMMSAHNMGTGQKYKCEQCDKSFQQPNQVRKHVEAVHEGVKHYCHICGRSYSYASGLKLHLESSHPDPPPGASQASFPCDGCDKVYNTKISLLSHKVHTCPGRESRKAARLEEAHIIVGGMDKVLVNKLETETVTKGTVQEETGKDETKIVTTGQKESKQSVQGDG